MPIDNKNRNKNAALAEIEGNDSTKIVVPPVVTDDSIPVTTPEPKVEEAPEVNLDELLAKDPSTLTAAEMDVLSENKESLTDEQLVSIGLADPELLNGEEPKPQAPAPEVPPVEEPKKDYDLEEKLAEQRREAQIISAQNAKITETIDKAAALPEPTEDELKAAVRADGAEWDDLTEFERKQFKKTFIATRQFDMVHQVTRDIHQIDDWAKKVDGFIEGEETAQKYKGLSGHEAQFRSFAMKESHRGIDIELLTKAFLSDVPEIKKKTGSLFPTGGGQAPEKPKGDKITDASEAANLRLSNPKEYGRQLRAGKIKIEV